MNDDVILSARKPPLADRPNGACRCVVPCPFSDVR